MSQGRQVHAAFALLLLAGCPNLQGVPALASPSPIDFGSVPLGAPPQTRRLQVENIGGSDLVVMGATMVKRADGIASDPSFSVGPFVGTLAPGQMMSTDVTFDINQAGASAFPAGRIQIQTDSSRSPKFTVPVVATKDTRSRLPDLTLDFGSVPALTRKTLAIQITSAGGSSPPTIVSPSSPFELGATTVSPDGELFEQEFTFAPTAAQSYVLATPLSYSPCSGCAPQHLLLKGQGIDTLVFEDFDGGILTSLDTGSVVLGVDAGVFEVLLVNQWNDQVTFDSLNDVSPFSASAVTGTMNPDAGVKVAVVFKPTVAGTASATLVASYHVDGSQPLASAPLTLMGQGISYHCSLTVGPQDVFFGYVPVGLTNKQSVTLRNNGALPCTVANLAIFPAGETPQFPHFLPIPNPVPALGVAALEVDFKPAPTVSPIHQRGAILTFDTGDPVNPDAGISLSGSLQLEAYGSSPWPKWHHDNGNTGLSPVDTSQNLGILAWQTRLSSGLGVNTTDLQGPSLDPIGALYQFSGDLIGTLYKLSTVDGSQITSSPPLPVLGVGGLDGGAGVAGVESTPTIVGGAPWLAIATYQSPTLQRILTFSGVPIADAGFGSSAPVAGFVGLDGGFDGGLYLANDLDSSVVRVSGGGAPIQRWDLCGGGPVCAIETFSGAVADDGTSYWTGGSSYAFALAADGTNLWSRSLSGGFSGLTVHTSPALLIATGVVYAVGAYQRDGGIFGGAVYALSQVDGGLLWKAPVPLPEYDSSLDSYPIGYSSPALRSDGTVVVGYRDGVYLISPQGRLLAVVQDATHSGVVGSAAIGADGRIYVGTLGGVLMAIDDKHCGADGGFCVDWSFAPSGTTSPIGSSPAIGADGTIYFMAGGQVFALQ